MLASIPPNLSVSQFMGYLKEKSSLIIFDHHANLKYKYGDRHFWCRDYYVNTAGADTRTITAYIQNQLAEDQALEQLTLKEYIAPFTGSKNELTKESRTQLVIETKRYKTKTMRPL